MLTNLDWLAEGKPWPPTSEKDRIDTYIQNELFFLSKHKKVWGAKFQELSAKLKKKNHSVDTVLNYHQLLSKKTADFVCGESPKIETEGETDELMAMLNKLVFFRMLYEGFIDVSRAGNGIVKFVGNEVTEVNPRYWFPIVDIMNLKRIINNVVAYPTDTDSDGKPRKLYVEIHSVGNFESRWYSFSADTSTIGAMIGKPSTTQTGLDISAVQVLSNLTHSGSIYGLDDYNIVNNIIAKIVWRLHCADTILDKHSEPSMTGPRSALQQDTKTGMWFVPIGNYFQRETKDDPDFSYVTWDGNLESNFKELELLLNQLYILSEMGQAFADAGGDTNDSSGTALKLRMVSPRIKAQRLVSINEATVKTIIYNLAKLNNINVKEDTLKIYWCDGLPVDEVEQMNMLTTATGGKAVMSQYSAIKKRGLGDDDAKIELQAIQNEETAAAPMLEVPRGVTEQDDDDTGGEDE